MENTIIYLIGHHGIGKLTTAKAICALTGARLFDNHLVNNVIFSLVRKDGKTHLPERVWDFTLDIRTIALSAMAEIAPPDFSFVLTNTLEDDDYCRGAYADVLKTAAQRNSVFVPVLLACDEAENMRRVAMPEREENMKLTDPAHALEVRQGKKLLPIEHPNRLEIDITCKLPEQTAAAIIAHAERLKP